MAHSLTLTRRPFIWICQHPPPFLSQRPPTILRPSSARRRWIRMPAPGAQAQQQRTPPQMSMDLMKQNQDGSKLPRDIGLFEGTFVMPMRSNRPSWIRSPRRRLKLQWIGFKHWIREFGGLLVYKTISKPRLKLERRKILPTALALHQEMYTAFAAGDLGTLRNICGEGLFASFKARIANRPPLARYEWTLHRYTKFARIVSDRAVRLPLDDAGQRQAIVRIISKQSLVKLPPLSPSSSPFSPTSSPAQEEEDDEDDQRDPEQKEIKEYLVLQRRYYRGKQSPWFVWGTVDETSLEEVERR